MTIGRCLITADESAKVFPNQVEDVVAWHPGMAEVAAVSTPAEPADRTGT